MSCGNHTQNTNDKELNPSILNSEQKNEQAESAKEKAENITSSFISKFDISTMLLENYFGAFGENYQRIDLKIKSINKKMDSQNEYFLIGSTVLKNKEVPYEGIIKISSVQKSNLNPYQIDDSTNYTIEINANCKFSIEQRFEFYLYPLLFI